MVSLLVCMKGKTMRLNRYVVSGMPNADQSDHGKRRDCFWCQAYSDEQALGWAKKRCGEYLSDFQIETKELVEG